MENKEKKYQEPGPTQKEKTKEKESVHVKNANAAGDGAMERPDETLDSNSDQGKKPLESNY